MTRFNKYYPDEFKKLRNAGKISSQCLDFLSDKIKPGVKTQEINNLCVNFLKKHNAVSAPLFYRGFPKSICTSVNHVVCHGIPSDKTLKAGDIINVDVTSFVDGFHGDTSRTYCVGKVSVKAKKLVEITKEALERSIKILKPGIHLGDIGYEIQSFVESNGYSVVRDFCGHGVGRNFHEEPNILHYGKKGTGPKLEEGMVFTIEPMINAGKYETKLLNDGWTAVTKDKSLSAQFEHTVGITNNGYEIFTLS
jgi:methionyl aminopeptidase